MIPQEFVDELLSKVDIVDIIDEYVPLKKSGANYMACCPFHKEKTPSFTVAPIKQFYHCFGCGAHGSAIGFLMEYSGLNFVETVEKLAQKVGMKVPQQQVSSIDSQRYEAKKQHQQSLEQTMTICADYYAQQLQKFSRAQVYINQRELSTDIAEKYGIGYASTEWQNLAHVFTDYHNELLHESGMVIDKDGKRYDRFRDRLMFPIRNIRGQVIGFGGRVIDKGEPKYLNSPETVLFDKGSQLYGLYEARSAIKDANKILVVEGYMDVLALVQNGIQYAVASLGTATTAEHIKLLMKHTDTIYFCFDGDVAGRKAAWRALENALPLIKDNKALYFLFLPEGQDPDSFVRQYGQDYFESMLIEKSQPLSEYLLSHLSQYIDLDAEEGKAKLIQSAGQIIAKIQASALKFLLEKKLAQKVNVDIEDLRYILGYKSTQNKKKSYREAQFPSQSFRQPAVSSLVEKQLKSLLIYPQLAQYVEIPDYFSIGEEISSFITIAEKIKIYKNLPTLAQILEMLRGTKEEVFCKKVFATIVNPFDELQSPSEQEQQAFQDGMQKLLNNIKNHQISQLLNKKAQLHFLSEDEENLLLTLLKH